MLRCAVCAAPRYADLLLSWFYRILHANTHPHTTHSIGKSAVQGQPLWVLEVSDKPGVPEPEPNFKYVCTMCICLLIDLVRDSINVENLKRPPGTTRC